MLEDSTHSKKLIGGGYVLYYPTILHSTGRKATENKIIPGFSVLEGRKERMKIEGCKGDSVLSV